jgi:5S rRNA maturation endonuclease (ribonuclease M5)
VVSVQDTAKYLIHADITADGVVERSDVVGAVFGQTEGLLGDELDIHGLQESSKLGRIDVEVESEGGQSFGRLTIASNLDRSQTAVLAAALETIRRVGPCRAHLEVRRIEDTRAARRREVVERAKELLATAFDDADLSSEEILTEVRESERVADVAEYEGLPAGPNVEDSDAVIVVEGRADVLTLLEYGIKNAVAVEGTDVPDAVADLTRERTATAFLDGDRGGDLVLQELLQVGDIDYIARAPEGTSVEDLSREAVTSALREKRPADAPGVPPTDDQPGEVGADGATADPAGAAVDGTTDGGTTADVSAADGVRDAESTPSDAEEPATSEGAAGDDARSGDAPAVEDESGAEPGSEPTTLPAHAEAVVGSGTARLLDAEGTVLREVPADDAFAAVRDADPTPHAVVLDATVEQALLDVAAQRGVARVVGADLGEFTKQPASVRVHAAADLQ